MQFTKPNAWKQRIELQVSHSLIRILRLSPLMQIPFEITNMVLIDNTLLNHDHRQVLFPILTIRIRLLVSNFKITPRRSLTTKYLLCLVKRHPRKNMNQIFHFNPQRVISNASKVVVHRLFQYRLLVVIVLLAPLILCLQITLVGFEKTPQRHHQTIAVVPMDLWNQKRHKDLFVLRMFA